MLGFPSYRSVAKSVDADLVYILPANCYKDE